MATTTSLPMPELAGQLRRAERRRKAFAVSLTLPLLIFLLVIFLVPIGALLMRAVENPEVANTLGRTGQALQGWDRTSRAARCRLRRPDGRPGRHHRDSRCRRPGAPAQQRNQRRTLADHEHLPRPAAGAGSEPGPSARTACWRSTRAGPSWRYWQAIAKNSSRWTPDYLLASVDLKRDVARRHCQSRCRRRPPLAASCCAPSASAQSSRCGALLLGFPLAYWLSTLSARKANMLMILVLVPFWTSILVRVGGLDRAAAKQWSGEPLADGPGHESTSRLPCCSTAWA